MTTNETIDVIESGGVARMLNISREGVFYLLKRGQLRPIGRTRRGIWLYDPLAVERLRLARAQRPKRKFG